VRAADRVAHAFASLAIEERPEAWIAVRPRADVDADAGAVDRRVRDGESLPLAGRVFAVKDNIDVAGLPTTAGCPSYAYHPSSSAPVVERLVGAGAIVLGKTNLDQFATGLVGTRSPYGAVRSAGDAERISGGSSSGSAVAVALGSFFGVTVLAPAFGDQMAAALARRLVGDGGADGGDDEGNLRPRRATGRWSDSRAVPA